MQEYERMPTKNEIATQTELSLQIIHKHLRDYGNHPLYLGQMEQYKFMASRVLASVFKCALSGDIGAAKLLFKCYGLYEQWENI